MHVICTLFRYPPIVNDSTGARITDEMRKTKRTVVEVIALLNFAKVYEDEGYFSKKGKVILVVNDEDGDRFYGYCL